MTISKKIQEIKVLADTDPLRFEREFNSYLKLEGWKTLAYPKNTSIGSGDDACFLYSAILARYDFNIGSI